MRCSKKGHKAVVEQLLMKDGINMNSRDNMVDAAIIGNIEKA